MSTLLLTHQDVVRHLDALLLMGELKEALKADSHGRPVAAQRARSVLHSHGTAVAIFPGNIAGIPAYTVKVHSKFPAQTPAIRGVIHLFDLNTGELLAIMDSRQVTSVRTGVLGAIAADALARPDAKRVALIGAGTQASLQVKSLRLVRSLEHVRIYDVVQERSAALAAKLHSSLALPVRMAQTLEEAVADADIVICSTWSREPLLFPNMVPKGCHITSLGADEPGKQELSRELILQGSFICDDRALALSSGAIGTAGLTEAAIKAELGEVLAGTKQGRSSPSDITLFAPVGPPIADLAAAWLAYQAALEDDQVQRIDFSGAAL
ncbi:MAG: ornithine cyclodeaminase family protein [Myxococcota bacterium]|nr:ornithine cyclodeaminase family protein [Myxococcota bacterium]